MKKSLLVALLLSGFTYVQAQISDEKRHFISFNVGASLPIGDYASTTITSGSTNQSGLATTGFNLSLEGAYYLTPIIGLGGMLGGFSNSVDNATYTSYLNSQIASTGYSTSSSSITSWSNGYFLVGPYVAIPLKSVTLDFKILGGALNNSSPQIDYVVSSPSYPDITAHEPSASATAFAYNFGMGARFNLTNQWALRVNADFISSSIQETSTATVSVSANTSSSSSSSLSQSNTSTNSGTISVINVGVGIAYQFLKK